MSSYEGEAKEVFIAMIIVVVVVFVIARVIVGLIAEHEIERSNQILCNHLYEYTGDYIACTKRYLVENLEDVKLTYRKGENPCLYEKEK